MSDILSRTWTFVPVITTVSFRNDWKSSASLISGISKNFGSAIVSTEYCGVLMIIFVVKSQYTRRTDAAAASGASLMQPGRNLSNLPQTTHVRGQGEANLHMEMFWETLLSMK